MIYFKGTDEAKSLAWASGASSCLFECFQASQARGQDETELKPEDAPVAAGHGQIKCRTCSFLEPRLHVEEPIG